MKKNNQKGHHKKRLNDRGQVSILVGTMMLTFILFFSFVVNTGMLVNAKINLQNAADLAAYAGASVQARQLTDISYLNYEMRRQFKKFLFRYYVVGNMAQQTHPRSQNQASGTRVWKPGLNSVTRFDVPAVCVTFNSGDNYCQLDRTPAIPIPQSAFGPPDAIMSALTDQLGKLERMRKEGCVGIGQTNMMLLYFWLLNTDINLDAISAEINTAGDAKYAARLRVLKTLASGLGLIPKELLLRKRIDTLNRYVNFAPQTGLSIGQVNGMQGGTDWAAKERPIQAFLSAYHTLGNNTFNDSEITMDELVPNGIDGANLLKLVDIKPAFDAYAVDLAIGDCRANNDNASATGDLASDCNQCLSPYILKNSLRPVVGVFKDPSVLTYYAVRLSAKAKVLFSPFGDMTLKAYAAAQPFGSRIGPQGDISNGEGGDVFFSGPGRPPLGNNNRCSLGQCVDKLPNLPVKSGESSEPSSSSGWNQNDVLFGFFSRFAPQLGNGGVGPVPSTLTHQDMLRAYHIAMAPNPWESGKYNIANDLEDDPFVQTFNQKYMHAIWAPIFNASATAANSNPTAEIIQMIEQFGTPGSSDSNAQSLFSPAAKQALAQGIETYINQYLSQGNGEDGEGSNVYRFFDPFMTRPENGSAQRISGLNASIYMSESDKVRTSWSDVLDANNRAKGRTGYSVKFVPLKQLGSGPGFENRIPTGAGVAEDIEMMQH